PWLRQLLHPPLQLVAERQDARPQRLSDGALLGHHAILLALERALHHSPVDHEETAHQDQRPQPKLRRHTLDARAPKNNSAAPFGPRLIDRRESSFSLFSSNGHSVPTATQEAPRHARPRCSAGGRERLFAPGPAHAAHHEAHVRKPGEGRGLEHALHDESLNATVHLEHDYPWERLTRVDLLPEFALALQNVEKLVHASQPVTIDDRTSVTGGCAVHQDLSPGDGHHRCFDHVRHVLCVGELHVLVDGQLTASRKAGEQEQNDAKQEVDEGDERDLLIESTPAATGDLLAHEARVDVVQQPPPGNADRLVKSTEGFLSG